MRRLFLLGSVIVVAGIALVSLVWSPILWLYVPVLPLVGIGLSDYFQRRRSVLRNFPIIGHFRFMFEAIICAILKCDVDIGCFIDVHVEFSVRFVEQVVAIVNSGETVHVLVVSWRWRTNCFRQSWHGPEFARVGL